MSISAVIRQIGPEDLEKLPNSRQQNLAKVQEYIRAYCFSLQGLSQRGVMKEMGHKHVRTTQNQIKKGEQFAKLLGIDTDRVQLKLAGFLDQVLDITLQQMQHQAEHGQLTEFMDVEGKLSYRKVKAVDPRLLGEAGRGAIRFAEFAGLMDRAPEQNTQTTLINLAAPKDGASFGDRWDKPVEASADPAVAAEPVAAEAVVAVEGTTVG